MGYTTTFRGRFQVDPPLSPAQVAEMKSFYEAEHIQGLDGAPSTYCQWMPTPDGAGIEWDQGEKFYAYVEWLELLIHRFLGPWGHVVSGHVDWQGEDAEDQGVIYAKDNEVRAVKNVITRPDPDWKVEKPEPRW